MARLRAEISYAGNEPDCDHEQQRGCLTTLPSGGRIFEVGLAFAHSAQDFISRQGVIHGAETTESSWGEGIATLVRLAQEKGDH